jgi:hypothetical protein
MSSNTWTLAELSSNVRALSGTAWRVVEAQSKSSTTKLTDTIEEQHELERLIEETKPNIPEPCRGLHWLLYTPFRYTPYPADSRFRRAGSIDGTFYCSEHAETAIAEMVFWRLVRFYAESPDTPWPANPGEYTAFLVEYASARALDLMAGPLNRYSQHWHALTDYSACLALSDQARSIGVDAIRYQSMRDPQSRANLALLSCTVFTQTDVTTTRTWRIHFSGAGERASCEFPPATLQFPRDAFAADPRLAGFRWDR